MEPQDNKRIALQKAISAHEQAAASLADLSAGEPAATHEALIKRIQQNLADLEAEATGTSPSEVIEPA